VRIHSNSGYLDEALIEAGLASKASTRTLAITCEPGSVVSITQERFLEWPELEKLGRALLSAAEKIKADEERASHTAEQIRANGGKS
jgi:hypothetical protein